MEESPNSSDLPPDDKDILRYCVLQTSAYSYKARYQKMKHDDLLLLPNSRNDWVLLRPNMPMQGCDSNPVAIALDLLDRVTSTVW